MGFAKGYGRQSGSAIERESGANESRLPGGRRAHELMELTPEQIAVADSSTAE